jgi:hypothetical protein
VLAKRQAELEVRETELRERLAARDAAVKALPPTESHAESSS